MKIDLLDDGIAFYTEDREYEIAFYSYITIREIGDELDLVRG